MYLAPAITPINSSVPGVGANNPGIRLYKYSRDTAQILDFTQYYLNLTAANIQQKGDWLEEYTATETYGIDDVTASSLFSLVDTFRKHHSEKFDKYYKYSTVSVDLDASCTGMCKRQHICSILYIDFDKFESCKQNGTTFGSVLESVAHGEETGTSTQGDYHHQKQHHGYRPVPQYMHWFIWGLAASVLTVFIITITVWSLRRLGRKKGYILLVE